MVESVASCSWLLHDVNGELHRAMSGTAENRTAADKGANLPGSEVHFGGLSFLRFDIEPELANAQSMRDIDTCEDEVDGLAFLQRDLGGFEGKSFCADFNATGLSVRGSSMAEEGNPGQQK